MALFVDEIYVDNGLSANTLSSNTLYIGSNLVTTTNAFFPAVTGTTISGGTYFSGNTPLETIIANISANNELKTYIQPGINTYTGGTAALPSVNLSSATLANLSTSGTNTAFSFSATSLSGGTYFSGSTPLETIIRNISSVYSAGTGIQTYVQNGTNTYTGGTAALPSVNVSALTISRIFVSGVSEFMGSRFGVTANTTSFTALTFTVSASTSINLNGVINSGATPLETIIQNIAAQYKNYTQNGTNTYTGGTAALPTVNISSATLANLSVSGNANFFSFSATSISGGTYFSGSTPLETIIRNISSTYSAGTGVHTWVQNGTNTYTGGTGLLPSVNVSALTINTLNASGFSRFISLSATTLSGGTIYSGTSELGTIIYNISHDNLTNNNWLWSGANLYNSGITGNVGVRTGNPTASLDIFSNSGTTNAFRIRSSGNTHNLFAITSDGEINLLNNANEITFRIKGDGTFGIGRGTDLTNAFYNDVAIGGFSYIGSTGDGKLAVGFGASANSLHSAAIGYAAVAATQSSLALGEAAKVTGGTAGIAIGTNMRTTNDYSVMLGTNTAGYATNTIADSFMIHIDGTPNGNYQHLFMNNKTNMVFRSNTELASGTHFDANATNTLTVFSGVSATTNIVGAYQQFGFNVSGHTVPAFRVSNGNIIQLYKQAAVTTSQGIADALTSIGLLDTSTIAGGVGSSTYVQPGTNTYTGGTYLLPSVNVSALTIHSILVTGSTAQNISGSTIFINNTNTTGFFISLGSSSAAFAGHLGTVGVSFNGPTGSPASALRLTGNTITFYSTGSTFQGLVNAASLSATTLSAGTYYSGSTPLESIISTIASLTPSTAATFVRQGLNTYTGGTSTLVSVNVSGLSINNLWVSATTDISGSRFAVTATTMTFTGQSFGVSATTIGLSGFSTNIRARGGDLNLIQDDAGDINITNISSNIFVQGGNIGINSSGDFNIGATGNVFITGNITSGVSSTNLETIIENIAAQYSATTKVQPGLNTYTGGTYLFPTVNISAATLVSLSSTTVSGGTIYSASTNIQTMFLPAAAYSGLTKITVSTTQPTAPSVGDLWINSN